MKLRIEKAIYGGDGLARVPARQFSNAEQCRNLLVAAGDTDGAHPQ